MSLIRWIKWKIKGKPFIQYSGFHCGCCGKWVEEQFKGRTIEFNEVRLY